MTQSRTTGLLLLLVGMLTFAGTTNELLPAIAFWPGAVVSGFGFVIFMKANHIAMNPAETHARPRTAGARPLARLEVLAEGQARVSGLRLEQLGEREGRSVAQLAQARQVHEDEIVLYEVDDDRTGEGDKDFVVTTDVSFPLELQQEGALADQLEKLQRLLDQEIITSEEFAIAKAKLLR